MFKAGKRFTAMLLILLLLLPETVLAAGGSAGAAPGRTAGTDQTAGLFRQNEVIIKFKSGYKEISAFARKNRLNIIRKDAKLNYILAKTQPKTNLTKLFATLSKNPDILYVQPNYIYQPFKTTNDPQYSRQWALKKVNAEKAWNITTGSPKIVVAVLDTGVDTRHPDLQGRLVSGTNTVNPLRSTRDDTGHGTHVAGIIAAAANNSTGIAGLANVRIMPVKVFDGEGGGSDISIADGIIWAADHGARVMNMSFGSFYRSAVLNDAIGYARKKGAVMVAAAGNWASETISYPAALKDVIAVSATNSKDGLSDFSSYGPEIDVSAPGEDIYSTYWDPYKGSTYREESGTSMASPMVAGVAALLLSKKPGLSADEVREIIEASATDLGEPGWDPKFGHGRIDVYKALTTSFARVDGGNNTPDKAVPLTDGQPVTGKIDYGSDADWYRINLMEKGALQVSAEPAGLVSPAVEIYSRTGELLAAFNNADKSDGDAGAGVARAAGSAFPGYDLPIARGRLMQVAETVYGLTPDLEAGDYFIKVFGNHNRWSKEDYRLTVSVLKEQTLVKDNNEPNDKIDDAATISLNQPLQGAVAGSGDVDWYKITLEPGRFYQLDIEVPSGLDLVAEIVKKESEDSYEGPEEAEYFNEIIDNTGQGNKETGVFRTTEKGSSVYYLVVYDKTGASVNANYSLKISGYSPIPDRYENNNTWKQAATVRVGDKVYANFTDYMDNDWYKIEIPAKGILEVKSGDDEGIFPGLTLFENPEKEPVGSDSWSLTGGLDKTRRYKVASGVYYLNASGYGRVSNQEYSLEFTLRDYNFIDTEPNDLPSQAVRVKVGDVRQGTLYPDGDADFYVLDLVKPEPVLVYLTPPKDINALIFVFKERDPGEDSGEPKSGRGNDGEINAGKSEKEPAEPELDLVAQIDSGKKGQTDAGVFVPGRPDRYYLAVTTWDPAAAGVYTLSLKPFQAQPDRWESNNTWQKAAPVKLGTAVKPNFMGTEDVDWFKVYIPSKAVLKISMTVPGDIDGVIEVYDSGAKLLGKIDSALTGEEEAGQIRINRPGWYYLKTYDYLGNASVQPYTLTVK